MSHHLDSPLARQDPRLNITDQYVFDADASTVLIMNVRTSLAKDGHAEPFHPEARYEFKIHLDGRTREDITYRFAFGRAEDGTQPFSVERLTGAAAGDDTADGTVIARGRTGQTLTTEEGGRVWAGEAVDPFYLDLTQLDAVDQTILHGGDADLTHWVDGVANDTFAGSTVYSIVLTVPFAAGELHEGRQIATWSTSKLATDAGGWRQVGRTGLPMIWPLFRDADTDAASHANETHPAHDAANYGSAIYELVASVVRRRGTSDRPEVYAANLVGRIVPDLLGYVVGTPALFGFAKFNGRRLADNAAEIMFSLATNSGIPGGLKAGDLKRSQEVFPYIIPASER
ncbi:DUF4331 domain-containing protein [Planotetraspora sp. A-T 1434]|uniref:DUF4331 domain-containing protein n=1 Tax=Planotetraspora sp. A-T 1434 TaxID=2979219 RepID=UPI0021BF979C|nr:DUF4331 domain-containing protein [Planotetraspora sp. A-T 1434]MCT9934474.1 DUF4331 domain-containing protein [Planotetraspora sp. A-T 1434]